jgi:cell fate (sporulation/competence/biofilm development) regulator YlbF (YheA/YmcA/DUF963 family)
MPTVTSQNREEFNAREMAKKSGRPFDPGELNIPNRLGNIDRDLDKYKAEQEKQKKIEQKEKSQTNKSNKQKAKELLTEHMDSILKVNGPKFGEAKIKAMLTDWSKWQPEKLIKFVERHNAEQQNM